MIKNKIVFEGKLAIFEQEGGYASPNCYVGEIDLTEAIEENFEDERASGKVWKDIGEVEGKWRLTLEIID